MLTFCPNCSKMYSSRTGKHGPGGEVVCRCGMRFPLVRERPEPTFWSILDRLCVRLIYGLGTAGVFALIAPRFFAAAGVPLRGQLLVGAVVGFVVGAALAERVHDVFQVGDLD